MTVPELLPGQSGLPVADPTASYWHREPSKVLLGHRTTQDLPPVADVVIVGSGITGAFAAHFLLEEWAKDSMQDGQTQHRGREVVMLEAREACWGATGRVSAFVHFLPAYLLGHDGALCEGPADPVDP